MLWFFTPSSTTVSVGSSPLVPKTCSTLSLTPKSTGSISLSTA